MNRRRVVRHERALRDLEDRSEYLRERNPQAALRFLDAAEETFALLAGRPGLGTRYAAHDPGWSELRFFPITRFRNDLVFYRPLPDGIEVLRVLHGARDIPGILGAEFGLGGDAGDEAED